MVLSNIEWVIFNLKCLYPSRTILPTRRRISMPTNELLSVALGLEEL